MKIYISGSISDGGTLPKEQRMMREANFHMAEKQLKAEGYEVINPARLEGREHCTSWLDYMRAALVDVAAADALAMLPGWHKSDGARLERNVALGLGLQIKTLADWLPSKEKPEAETQTPDSLLKTRLTEWFFEREWGEGTYETAVEDEDDPASLEAAEVYATDLLESGIIHAEKASAWSLGHQMTVDAHPSFWSQLLNPFTKRD